MRQHYGVSGTDLPYDAMAICYAISGTDLAYGATPICYAVSGRAGVKSPGQTPYLPTECPVFAYSCLCHVRCWHTVAYGSYALAAYAMSGSCIAYGAILGWAGVQSVRC
eukprot:2651315-Rhodomonas_salina.2